MAKAWYVLHVYSGYENKIERTIRMLIDNGDLSRDIVTDIKVPSEEVVDVKDGKKRSILAQDPAGIHPRRDGPAGGRLEGDLR